MKNKLVNIFISPILTIVPVLIIPGRYFDKYKIEQISENKILHDIQYYYSDLDNDGYTETIEYIRKKSPGHSIDITRGNTYLDLYNSENEEFFMSENLEFADNDQNGLKEIYFISAYRNNAYLNILEFNEKSNTRFISQKVLIDTIENYNDYPDIVNFKIDFLDKNNIVFDLHAGFSIQPRKIYIYNTLTKELKKSPLNSIAIKNFKFIYDDNKEYILPTEIYASGNCISFEQKSDFEKSSHPDTVILYKKYINNVYQYGDFSSYTLLYNKDIEYIFPPVEHKGWTKNTFSENIKINNQTHIVSLTKSLIDSTFLPNLIIVNLKGEIIKKRKLTKQGDIFMRLYVNHLTDNIIILNQENEELLVYDNQLELIKKVKTGDNPNICGFRDLENDNIPELVTIENHKLIIYENNLKSKTELPLHFCGKSLAYIYTFRNNNNAYIHLEIGDSSFVLYFHKIRFYYLKNFLHLVILILWYLFIWFVQKLNTRRLESENIRLEKIVKERIIELQLKNEELNKQKEEIHTRTEELKTVNEHLVKLDKFKQVMTGMIVHDLKNPLNIIINSENIAFTKQSGHQMLTMVKNILDVQKFEEAQVNINLENKSIRLIAQNALQQVSLLIEYKNLNVENNIPPEYGALSDEEKTTRIFINILTNAVKFTPSNGSITLSCEVSKNKQKEETKESKSSYLKISITDTGIGIPPDKLNKVFDKFEQVEAKKSGEAHSTGLGLTFCKLAVEAQGGEIGVESEPDKGCTFWFTIPRGDDIILNRDVLSEQNRKSEPELTSSDKQYLLPFIDKLKKLEVYDISESEKILNNIDSSKSKGITQWINKIKNALFINDEDLFAELLKF